MGESFHAVGSREKVQDRSSDDGLILPQDTDGAVYGQLKRRRPRGSGGKAGRRRAGGHGGLSVGGGLRRWRSFLASARWVTPFGNKIIPPSPGFVQLFYVPLGSRFVFSSFNAGIDRENRGKSGSGGQGSAISAAKGSSSPPRWCDRVGVLLPIPAFPLGAAACFGLGGVCLSLGWERRRCRISASTAAWRTAGRSISCLSPAIGAISDKLPSLQLAAATTATLVVVLLYHHCFAPPAKWKEGDFGKQRDVLCLEHRSYAQHSCPNADQQDVTVLICPLCAKGVRLIPSEDSNITWEAHVNTDCDPSNYEKATKKKRCPVPGCKEILVFSNTIKCRDCGRDHCLKHRFGLDHNCPGPKKPDTGFPFMSMLRGSQKGPATMVRSSSGSTWWGSGFLSAASSVRASAESSLARLSSATSQALQKAKDGMPQSSVGGPLVEQCVQCPARFSSVTALIDHVEKVHESGKQVASRVNTSIDVCPKCSKGFSDPVSLVMHVERDHGAVCLLPAFLLSGVQAQDLSAGKLSLVRS
ncbi:hypothetical protein Taro_050641 [Colocasia esculenta]|uniref:Zinc finger AN1 and C2H2 domain-containing stress-associated protein 16 n=1 Tax=Colocasia esculenta TaxID=4460 RepID=A0A843XES8_COLES|nr:hypothetical protein [Colocasia esculenta]